MLQRLFTFLGQRDPVLNNDILAAVPVPKTARPNYALTKQALQASPLTAAAAARRRRRAPAARSYAASIIKAAAARPPGGGGTLSPGRLMARSFLRRKC